MSTTDSACACCGEAADILTPYDGQGVCADCYCELAKPVDQPPCPSLLENVLADDAERRADRLFGPDWLDEDTNIYHVEARDFTTDGAWLRHTVSTDSPPLRHATWSSTSQAQACLRAADLVSNGRYESARVVDKHGDVVGRFGLAVED